MKTLLLPLLVGVLGLAAACEGMRRAVAVTPGEAAPVADALPREAAMVVITEGDITGVPYEELGEIRVTLSKNTMFGRDPTERMLERALQEEAAEMGADAVVRVRYGEVGVSLTSWGSVGAAGLAVRFVN